jgi:elongation factor G
MPNANGGKGPRAVALVGPYGSGKTTLLESLLFATGATQRKGSIALKNTVGDSSPEARARQMSVEINCATADYLGQNFTFLDCPGSIEFLQDTLFALAGVDVAVVVVEPEAAKVQMLKPFLKRLTDLGIPHLIYVNKIDKATGPVQDLLDMLQGASDKPLLLRQIPTATDGVVTGFVDLALERAFVYREHAPSEVVEISDTDSEKSARFAMLEKLADYDELLMEELLSDVEPGRDRVFDDLRREMAEGLVVPVLIGSAENDHGIRRLLKAMRHEAPDVSILAQRLGVSTAADTVVQVVKTIYSGQGGKLSLARVLSGTVKDGATLRPADGAETRVGGIFALKGSTQTKLAQANVGETVALARLDGVATGDKLSSAKTAPPKADVERLTPVYRLAIAAADRKDEVKITAAIAKLREEDPSIVFEQDADLHQMVLAGQGEIHLKVAVEKMMSRYGLKINVGQAKVPYKETIRKATTQRGRHKRQSGGHGQFGDVVLVIKPQPRGVGFEFVDEIVGGVVPRQWIPSVEKGVVDFLKNGPLGFPVVDVSVALVDGSYHTVDSSDAAFQTAARIGMQEGMPECSPVLLEPILHVRIHVPSEATAKVNSVVSGRRGAILGFDARDGWKGWDTVEAEMPQAEIGNLIIELRSLTQGVGTYEAKFDHLAELTGKVADQIVAAAKAAKEAS